MDLSFPNKCKVGVLLLLILLLFSGCSLRGREFILGYPNTKWVCADPYIQVEVGEVGKHVATIGTGESQKQFELCSLSGYFGNGVVEAFAIEEIAYEGIDGDMLFSGDYKARKNRCTITLSKDNLWDGAYEELEFIRIE